MHLSDAGQENGPSKGSGSDPREVAGKRGLAQADKRPSFVQFCCLVFCQSSAALPEQLVGDVQGLWGA